MAYFFEAINEISYTPSKWCFDMLNLQNEDALQPGALTIVQYADFWSSTATKPTKSTAFFDRVFAISLDTLIAVNFDAQLVVTYHYTEPCYQYANYKIQDTHKWLDVVCAASYSSKNYGNPYTFSLFILTEGGKIITLELNSDSKKFVRTHDITINSKHRYTQILLVDPHKACGQDSYRIYLWTPQRKILQQFEIDFGATSSANDSQGIAQPVPLTEVKIRNPRLDGQEIAIEGCNLTLAIDYKNSSILCADCKNHILFECSMKSSQTEVLCGRGIPGKAAENTPSKAAYLSSPCFPLVFRPQEYVEKGRFSMSAKNILGASNKARPRLLLVCDPGNDAVRKIWQFPNSPQALDLANFDQINTLVGELPERSRHLDATLCIPCVNPRALYVNPCGLLTITTEKCAYIIASYSVIPEQKTITSDVSGSS